MHASGKEEAGDMGSSDVPSLGVFVVVWLVFEFCFAFGTENSNKHSPAAVACSQQASHINLWWLMCLLLSALLGERLVWIGSAL